MRQRTRITVALGGATLWLLSACGGRETSPLGGVAGAGAESAGTAGTNRFESAGAAGAHEVESAGAAGKAATPPNYVPSHDVPFDHTYLQDGSFESNPGFGYDTCATRTPASLQQATDGASQGSLAFQFSSGSCVGICSPNNPDDAQIYLWFRTEPSSAAVGLYFDMKSLSQAAPEGELRVAAVDSLCVSIRDLARAALSDLSLKQDWQTRCIDLPALTTNEALGIAVTGSSFQIALDALRIGPACH